MTQHIFNVDTSSDRRAMRKWMKQRHKQVKSNPFFAVAQTYLSVTESVNDCSNSYLEKEGTLVLCLWVGCPEPVRQAVGRSRGHVVSQSQRLLLQLFWSIPGHQTLALALQTHQKQTVSHRHVNSMMYKNRANALTHPRMLEVWSRAQAGRRSRWRDRGGVGRWVQRSCKQHHVIMTDVTLQLIREGQTEHIIYSTDRKTAFRFSRSIEHHSPYIRDSL